MDIKNFKLYCNIVLGGQHSHAFMEWETQITTDISGKTLG
jgi:hypothetical protein